MINWGLVIFMIENIRLQEHLAMRKNNRNVGSASKIVRHLSLNTHIFSDSFMNSCLIKITIKIQTMV